MPPSADEAVAPDQLWPGGEIPMPMYYFHLRDSDDIMDTDGTELADVPAARDHADTVARELMFKTSGIDGEDWSRWTMVVHDSEGVEVHSFAMSGTNGNGGK
jgi:hypothetical protein